MKNKEITFDIIKHICVLSDSGSPKGWTKELNIVSWNGGQKKGDIREWNSDHTLCGKGITLTSGECDILFDGLNRLKLE